MGLIGAWWVAASAAVSEVSVYLLELLFGPRQPRLTVEQEREVDRVDAMADDLFTVLRRNKTQIAEDAKEAFRLIGSIPQIFRWDAGLKESLSALILAAVEQAERFGDGTGEFKRRFAIDLIVRVLQRYNAGQLPFLSIERLLIEPVVGILIDWSVKVLDINVLWPRVERVTLPRIFQGGTGALINLARWAESFIVWVKNGLFFPSKYERQLRQALAAVRPEADSLLDVLPPTCLHANVEDLVNVIVKLGRVTAPYVGLVEKGLRLLSAFSDLDDEQRTEVVFRMLRELVIDAYADDDEADMILLFIDSPFGDYLLHAIVEHTMWVLERNGLLLVTDLPASQRAPRVA